MGNFNRGNKSGGGRSFNSRRNFNERGSDRVTLHKTTCSKCAKACEVPFRPTGAKPVFCRECYRENAGQDSRRSDRNFSRPNFENRNTENPKYGEQLEAINIKLDKILRILKPEVQIVQKETAQTELQQEEQILVPEKKKRAAKKVPLTTEELV